MVLDIRHLTKPIYIKFRLSTLLIFLLVLALLITGVVLYKHYVFHNWFFSTLSADAVEAIYVGDAYHPETQLPADDAEKVIALLRNIRLQEEPYDGMRFVGASASYRIRLKNGIEFELMTYPGDLQGGPLMYIFGTDGYKVGTRDDPESAAVYENMMQLEMLLQEYIDKYCP